jgi:hypothetical protein
LLPSAFVAKHIYIKAPMGNSPSIQLAVDLKARLINNVAAAPDQISTVKRFA